MALDNRTGSLIAVGASITANCQPWLEINRTRALKAGADAQEVADAVEIGRKVRAGAASKLDSFAATLNVPAASAAVANTTCGCGS
jgi:AhpD family alkylhydroperoxidase